ncbi:unnamed protein product [Brassica rapa]|uniref:Uncharacterized protein n=2 Tax=Brassica TaxID=3705 RepID=A0A8D9GLY1_BRACM|nr:unnamed protein product [Brassica napus]CAG7883052.1 unnamed protein product [Brassica rapa]
MGTVPVDCKRHGNLQRKILNDGIFSSYCRWSLFLAYFGLELRFFSRVSFEFSLKAVRAVSIRV